MTMDKSTKAVLVFFLAALIPIALAFAAAQRSNERVPIEVVRVKDPLLKEADPNALWYKLLCNGREIGIIELDSDAVAIAQMLLRNPDEHRTVTLTAKRGAFPSAVSTEMYAPTDAWWPITTIYDDNADGIPDRKVEWKKSKATIYKRAKIDWRLFKSN